MLEIYFNPSFLSKGTHERYFKFATLVTVKGLSVIPLARIDIFKVA